ncbi:MAG: hypothetical protein L0H96_09585 [Humibacillus sp.]|nr:hypothetical protein [Humibacillus sp.]MDN5777150.1 hypothetical protein [Humibacillus sp.]
MTTTAPVRATATNRRTAAPRARAQSGILGAMNREWDHLGHSPSRHPDGTRWATTHPCLQDLATVSDILDALRHSPSGSPEADELLRSLLDLNASGTGIAGRALIHTMMPRILKLTFTAEARGLDDPAGAALEAMWSAISHFPTAKPHRIAACLALNALNALPNPREAALTLEPAQVEFEVDREALAGRGRPVSGLTAEDEVARLLGWAQASGVLARGDVDLLAVLHQADAPSQNELALRLGISRQAMWKRASRATARLRDAVARAHTAPRP